MTKGSPINTTGNRISRSKISAVIFIVLMLSSAIILLNGSRNPNALATNAADHALIVPEPLAPTSTSISKNLTFPSTILFGSPRLNVTSTNTFYPDGQASIGDANGNLLTLVPKILTGNNVSNGNWQLLANSTVIDQRFVSPTISLDMIWKTRTDSGYANGYKLTIQGRAINPSEIDFSVVDNSTLSLLKSNNHAVQLSSDASRIIIGQRAGDNSTNTVGGVGFDWSDAISYKPIFQSNTLRFNVASDFSIDPYTVVTTTDKAYDEFGQQHRIIVANDGGWWLFYGESTSLKYAVSINHGKNWTTFAPALDTQINQNNLDVDYIKTGTYANRLQIVFGSNGNGHIIHYYGIPVGNTITWSSRHDLGECGAVNTNTYYPSVLVTGNSSVSVVYGYIYNSNAFCEVTSNDGGSTFGSTVTLSARPGGADKFMNLHALNSSNADEMIVETNANEYGSLFSLKRISGVWDSSRTTITTDKLSSPIDNFDSDYDSSHRVHLAYIKNDNTLQYRKYSGGAWSNATQLDSAQVSGPISTMVDPSQNVFVFYNKSNAVNYVESSNGGNTWTSPQAFTTHGASPYGIETPHRAFNSGLSSFIPVIYVNGTSSPYKIWSSTFVIPTTASSDSRLDSSGEQRTSYFDGTYNWIFYYNGTNIYYKYTSDGGITWGTPVSSGTGALASNSYFTVYGEGSKIMIAYSSSTNVLTRNGTISGTSISWSTARSALAVTGTNAGQQFYPSIEKVNSTYYLGFNVMTSSNNSALVRSSTSLGGAWSPSVTLYSGLTNPATIGLSKYGTSPGTKLFVLYARYNESDFAYRTLTSAWSSTLHTSGAGLFVNQSKTSIFSVTSNGTCVIGGYIGKNAGGSLASFTFCGSSFTYPATHVPGKVLYPTISAIGKYAYLSFVTNNTIYQTTFVLNNWSSYNQPFGNFLTSSTYLHEPEYGSITHWVYSEPIVWRETTTSPSSIYLIASNVGFKPSGIPILSCSSRGGNTSGDSICDYWKSGSGLNINYNGSTYSYPCDTVCPVYNHKDIYVEADYTTGFKPYFNTTSGKYTGMEDVRTAFANSPVTNPDGLTGVNLHYNVGEDSGAHYYLNLSPTTFYDIKTNFFGTSAERQYSQNAIMESSYLTAKWQIFHYAVFGERQSGMNINATGIADINGNDILITLAAFTNPPASVSDEEGTFMHELGHNLGLNHGGPTDGTNCKPNYLSVMNYFFSTIRIVSDRPLDYSRSILTSLNESNLSEPAGVSTSTPPGLQTAFGNNITNASIDLGSTGGVPVDWNRHGGPVDTHVVENINNAGGDSFCNNTLFTVLTGANDWSNLKYDFRDSVSGYFSNGEADPGTLPHELDASALKRVEAGMVLSIDNAVQSSGDSNFTNMMSAKASKLYFHSSFATAKSLMEKGDVYGALQILLEVRTKIVGDSGGDNHGVLLVNNQTQHRILFLLDNRIAALKSELNLA